MKPQKALHMFQETDKKNPKYIGKEYAIFEKYDGWYGYMDHDSPIMSRQCRAIPSLTEFSKEINLPYAGRLIFEIMVAGTPEFHIMNGILNRSKGDCEAKDAYLLVHDFIPEDGLGTPFMDRYEIASHVVELIGSERVRMASIIATSSLKEAWEHCANKVWLNGGEGVILKNISAGYSEGKRNADLMKIKEEVTLDLLVTGMEIGEGKYCDTLGSLTVKSKNGIEHSISGMTDTDRYAWWDSPDDIIGKVVEVKAMKILSDGSLREPRFKAVRWDKNESEID